MDFKCVRTEVNYFPPKLKENDRNWTAIGARYVIRYQDNVPATGIGTQGNIFLKNTFLKDFYFK